MRSRVAILLAVFMVIMVAPAAMATNILDTTLVQEWTGHTASSVWTTIIGTSVFETTEIDVSLNGTSLSFSIFTAFPLAGTTVGKSTPVPIADLALDLDNNGTFEKAVVLHTHGTIVPGLYDVNTDPSTHALDWDSAEDLWADSGNYIYGGRYDDVNKLVPYTQMTSGTLVEGLTVTQGTNEIDFTLTNITPSNWSNFYLFWGTGTCDNDGIAGTVGGSQNQVPEPATLILVGAGLIGIGGLARRKLGK